MSSVSKKRPDAIKWVVITTEKQVKETSKLEEIGNHDFYILHMGNLKKSPLHLEFFGFFFLNRLYIRY